MLICKFLHAFVNFLNLLYDLGQCFNYLDFNPCNGENNHLVIGGTIL